MAHVDAHGNIAAHLRSRWATPRRVWRHAAPPPRHAHLRRRRSWRSHGVVVRAPPPDARVTRSPRSSLEELSAQAWNASLPRREGAVRAAPQLRV